MYGILEETKETLSMGKLPAYMRIALAEYLMTIGIYTHDYGVLP